MLEEAGVSHWTLDAWAAAEHAHSTLHSTAHLPEGWRSNMLRRQRQKAPSLGDLCKQNGEEKGWNINVSS